ncbi:hypothetical protein ATANTOWER_009810 [Ataeniobius toweri]|uniref:Uncharacterized protein n=1 Tax=Ataeniobius toweri TaxID=208326 RepID=A0ABU7C9Y3_9TELE|nr:hypothetical protein [Ataeniobius toweri]
MVNGLYLYSALSSPTTPKLFYTTISHTSIHTLTVVDYILARAALGQPDRTEVAIQSVPPSPLTTFSRQGGGSVLPKDTMIETDSMGSNRQPTGYRTNLYLSCYCCPIFSISSEYDKKHLDALNLLLHVI